MPALRLVPDQLGARRVQLLAGLRDEALAVELLALPLARRGLLQQGGLLPSHPRLPVGGERLLVQPGDLGLALGDPRVEELGPRPLLRQFQLALLEVGAEAAELGDGSLEDAEM